MYLFEKFINYFNLKKHFSFIRSRVETKIIKKENVSNNKPIDYLISDPATPLLTKKIIPPQQTNTPFFNIIGYKGGGYNRISAEGQAANCYITISNTLNIVNSQTNKKIPNWPGASSLQVFPRAGVDLNAYYDRKSLRFFYINNPQIGGSLFTCDSSDVVSHELGHAILDAYRPETWSAMSLEIMSMHEAFADFIAIINIMSHQEILEYAINQTNGDMKKPNIISNLAEHFGQAVYKLSKSNSGRNKDCLRCAINDFKYVNPNSLPTESEDGQIAAECHSFGRIFLGAFYDLIVLIYEDKKTSLDCLESLKQSRDISLKYVLKAIQHAPLNSKFYQSVAKTILWADLVLGDGKYQDKIQEIFKKRNLLTTQVKMLSAPKCENNEFFVKKSNFLNIKLKDYLISSQSEQNFLYDVEVEIPNEKIYLYDLNNNIYDSLSTTEEEDMVGAVDALNYLKETNQVSQNANSPFEIVNGKLQRKFIS